LGKTDDKSIENKTEIKICLIILQAHSRAHKQTPRKRKNPSVRKILPGYKYII
jgi:hypothetical protein